MSRAETFIALAERVRRLGSRGDNSLDVQCEIALFEPGTAYTGVRSNDAGTKVIYTDRAGNDVTCWSEDWTVLARRDSTIAALRTRAASLTVEE